jgi:hypothetical protein
MAWQPEDETLRQLVQCLDGSLALQNPSVKKNADVVGAPAASQQDSCAD